MSNLPPAEVLAKRLEHELKTALFLAEGEDLGGAVRRIPRALEILAQLQEAMK